MFIFSIFIFVYCASELWIQNKLTNRYKREKKSVVCCCFWKTMENYLRCVHCSWALIVGRQQYGNLWMFLMIRLLQEWSINAYQSSYSATLCFSFFQHHTLSQIHLTFIHISFESKSLRFRSIRSALNHLFQVILFFFYSFLFLIFFFTSFTYSTLYDLIFFSSLKCWNTNNMTRTKNKKMKDSIESFP